MSGKTRFSLSRRKIVLGLLFALIATAMFLETPPNGQDYDLTSMLDFQDFQDLEEFIKSGGSVDHRLENGHTLLTYALSKNYKSIAKELIRRGANINLGDKDDTRPIQFSAKYGSLEMFQLLLDQGADPKHIDKVNQEALTFAARGENLDLVKLLVEKYGQDPNRPNPIGGTPLVVAAENNNIEIFKYLLSKGANIAVYKLSDNAYTKRYMDPMMKKVFEEAFSQLRSTSSEK